MAGLTDDLLAPDMRRLQPADHLAAVGTGAGRLIDWLGVGLAHRKTRYHRPRFRIGQHPSHGEHQQADQQTNNADKKKELLIKWDRQQKNDY